MFSIYQELHQLLPIGNPSKDVIIAASWPTKSMFKNWNMLSYPMYEHYQVIISSNLLTLINHLNHQMNWKDTSNMPKKKKQPCWQQERMLCLRLSGWTKKNCTMKKYLFCLTVNLPTVCTFRLSECRYIGTYVHNVHRNVGMYVSAYLHIITNVCTYLHVPT